MAAKMSDMKINPADSVIDTVSGILQERQVNRKDEDVLKIVVVFAGKKNVGKTTAAEYISEKLFRKLGISSEIYGFADPIRELAHKYMGYSHSACYGTDEDKVKPGPDLWAGINSRKMLQDLGASLRSLRHNFFTCVAQHRVEQAPPGIVMFHDARMPEELDFAKTDYPSLSFEVIRPSTEDKKDIDATETSEFVDVNGRIINDGPLIEYYSKLDIFAEMIARFYYDQKVNQSLRR